jgi:MHS family alpha-ketoglutarate permease-like MFS transporter
VAGDSKPGQLRQIFGGAAGNLVEWYDWYAYSAFALYFGPRFFPPGDDLVAALNSAAIFAVGFLMRPIGSWLLGAWADKRGRKSALTLSVAMMCSGSLLMSGCWPRRSCCWRVWYRDCPLAANMVPRPPS